MSQEERLHKAYFEGLETPFETSQRAEALAKDVFREAEDGETVLFVTHSNLISEWYLRKTANGFQPKDYKATFWGGGPVRG